MPRGYCQRHGRQFGPCSCSLGKLSRLVEPILLYLLARGEPSYGYDLMEKARRLALTDTEIDPGVVYRTLRMLEQAACVRSYWEPGPGGPDRRIYELTGAGHEHLQDWATVMERVGSHMADLAQACRELEQERAPTA
jgi:PadR family transcriptional regulator PadR